LVDGDGTPIEVVRESYRHVPYGGIYRADDLVVGERILIAAGLLEEHDGVLYPGRGLAEMANAGDADGCEALVVVLLTRRPPLWLIAATASDGIIAEELVPTEETELLDGLLEPEYREALLLQLGRRFRDEEMRRVGDLAERHVVKCCETELCEVGRRDLAKRVRRVSATSDQLGYDVTAPRLDGSTRRLECKGTKGTGPIITVFISRNEAKRGQVDSAWALVACQVDENDKASLVGWLPGTALVPLLPADPSAHGRWESARVEIETAAFAPGLPPIG
jgi:hypothetical protein